MATTAVAAAPMRTSLKTFINVEDPYQAQQLTPPETTAILTNRGHKRAASPSQAALSHAPWGRAGCSLASCEGLETCQRSGNWSAKGAHVRRKRRPLLPCAGH